MNSAGAVATITAKNESFRAGTAYEFFISTPKAQSLMMLPRSSVAKYKNTDVCFIRTKDGFVPKRVSVVKDTKDGVYIKNNDIADGASVAVGGIVNLKGALSGMGFEWTCSKNSPELDSILICQCSYPFLPFSFAIIHFLQSYLSMIIFHARFGILRGAVIIHA